MYSKESAKWKAYQFCDPFATNAFVVANKINQIYCRPDCDSIPKTNLKNEIKFFDNANEAGKIGFMPCKHCDPNGKSLIDVELLMQCVTNINEKIGFLKPLIDENEDLNNVKIKENILISKKSNEETIMNVLDKSGNDYKRRQSMPNLKSIDSINLSKNDGDHYRLVDLACRHLAYAAAINLFFPQKFLEDDSNVSIGKDGKKKRRRGGVLGFKELAAKSKLSAWHFHRVFKSVTGLTPKNYGDKCNDFLEKFKDSKYINHNSNHNSNIYNKNINDTSMHNSNDDFNLSKSDSLPDLTKFTLPTTQLNLPQQIETFESSPKSQPVIQNIQNTPLQLTDNQFEGVFDIPELTQDLEINELLSSTSSSSFTPPNSSPEAAPSLFNYEKPYYNPISINNYNLPMDNSNVNYMNMNGLSNSFMNNASFMNTNNNINYINNVDFELDEFNDLNEFLTTV